MIVFVPRLYVMSCHSGLFRLNQTNIASAEVHVKPKRTCNKKNTVHLIK